MPTFTKASKHFPGNAFRPGGIDWGRRILSMAMVIAASDNLPMLVMAEDAAKTTRSPQALSVRTQGEVERISSIIDALRIYAAKTEGKYPAKMDDLVQKNILTAEELKRLTMSPLGGGEVQGDGYQYFFEGKTIKSPLTDVLVMGRNPLAPNDSRRAVGLQDGSVTWWRRAQVDAFLKAAKKAK
jgi:hypothetical protein